MSAILLFRVKCHTEFTQSVIIVGNRPELGNWDPKKGLKLRTNPEMYPLWTLDQSVFVDEKSNIELKLVITDGRNYHWESIPNRLFRIKDRKQLLILTYNNSNQTIQCLQSGISDTDLGDLHLVKRRRIGDFKPDDYVWDNNSETDNNEGDSDIQSLFKDDTNTISDFLFSPEREMMLVMEIPSFDLCFSNN